MKELKGLIAFIVLVILPLVFWLEGYGYTMRQNGFGWLVYLLAPITAAIFAFVVSGKPGKGLITRTDQGNIILSRFWWVFILLTVVNIGIAIMLSIEK